MMKKYIGLAALAAAMTLTSCDDFLDKLPDNRTEANTTDKIERLLVAAYPTVDPIIFTEYASDNMDDMGAANPNTDRFLDQVWHWQDATEDDNGSPERYWANLYQCIETANMALEGIESMGGATTTELKEAQAEALLCRAYAHFMLTNVFAMHYDPNDASAPGVTYITGTEKKLNPKYERETVHENYKHIEQDLEAALPNVGDSYYTAPKYHFNRNAAYAFATRFYLYYGKYDKAIEYADRVLGTNPKVMLRDFEYMSTMTRTEDAYTLHYIDASLNANLLLLTSTSMVGWYFGNYYDGKRYSHNAYVGENETISALAALWGGSYDSYYYVVGRYSGTNINAWLLWHLPFGQSVVEWIDPVAGTGYPHTVYNAFTADEVLLNRAEAYILKKEYDKAASDMTLWTQNVSRMAAQNSFVLTPEYITDYMNSIDYAYEEYGLVNGNVELITNRGLKSTMKKHLNPKFDIDAEGSTQESMLQAVIAMRRLETIHEGKRWFDIKRWGIVIPRRIMNEAGTPQETIDWLEVDDPRRAVQIPQDVREAGYEPNARKTTDDGDAAVRLPENYLQK